MQSPAEQLEHRLNYLITKSPGLGELIGFVPVDIQQGQGTVTNNGDAITVYDGLFSLNRRMQMFLLARAFLRVALRHHQDLPDDAREAASIAFAQDILLDSTLARQSPGWLLPPPDAKPFVSQESIGPACSNMNILAGLADFTLSHHEMLCVIETYSLNRVTRGTVAPALWKSRLLRAAGEDKIQGIVADLLGEINAVSLETAPLPLLEIDARRLLDMDPALQQKVVPADPEYLSQLNRAVAIQLHTLADIVLALDLFESLAQTGLPAHVLNQTAGAEHIFQRAHKLRLLFDLVHVPEYLSWKKKMDVFMQI